MFYVHLVAIDDFTSRNLKLCLLVNVFVYRHYPHVQLLSCGNNAHIYKDCRNTSKKCRRFTKDYCFTILSRDTLIRISFEKNKIK